MNGLHDQVKRFRVIYHVFRKVSDNAHGNVKGVSGSLTPGSLHKVLTDADVFGLKFLDIGAGDGRAIAAALASGASSASGFELPDNQATAFIFEAAMRKIEQSMLFTSSTMCRRRARLDFTDIEQVQPDFFDQLLSNAFSNPCYSVWQVNDLPAGTEIVFTFWVGFPFSTQIHILYLCACCDSLKTLIVFRDGKWRKPDQILRILEKTSERKWSHFRTIITSMHGSGERKTAWIFLCD